MHKADKARLGKRTDALLAGPKFRRGKRLIRRFSRKVSKGGERRRILVADQHPLFRYGLQRLVDRQRGLISTGEADSAQSLKALLAIRLPDLLVMGLRFPGEDGIELIKTLRTSYPALPILVLSGLDETVYAERAMRAGASGFIRKHETLTEIVAAIRRVLAAELYLSRTMSARLLRQMLAGSGRTFGSGFERLSDRELNVFQLLGSGLTSRKVAMQLGISLKTVESHRENIKHKLGFNDGAELARHAVSFVEGTGGASRAAAEGAGSRDRCARAA